GSTGGKTLCETAREFAGRTLRWVRMKTSAGEEGRHPAPLLPSARRADQAERLELEQHLVRAMVGIDGLGVELEFRLVRSLVRIGYAGELLDLALARQLVETLAVAPLALLQAGRDVHLDEGAVLLDHLAHGAPGCGVGRDRRAERDTAILGDLGRDVADPANVDVAVLLGEAELGGPMLAD